MTDYYKRILVSTAKVVEDWDLLEKIEKVDPNTLASVIVAETEEWEKDGIQPWFEELEQLWDNPMSRVEDFGYWGRLESAVDKALKLELA